jgi:hypothetical protein
MQITPGRRHARLVECGTGVCQDAAKVGSYGRKRKLAVAASSKVGRAGESRSDYSETFQRADDPCHFSFLRAAANRCFSSVTSAIGILLARAARNVMERSVNASHGPKERRFGRGKR